MSETCRKLERALRYGEPEHDVAEALEPRREPALVARKTIVIRRRIRRDDERRVDGVLVSDRPSLDPGLLAHYGRPAGKPFAPKVFKTADPRFKTTASPLVARRVPGRGASGG